MESIEMAQDPPVWHEIVIEDPLHLTGESTHGFVMRVLSLSGLDWVYFRNFDGAFTGLSKSETNILQVRDFLPLLIEADQYDWGDIFLSARPVQHDPAMLSDSELISRSEVSLFLVDDNYFFVYTADDDVATELSCDVNVKWTARKTIDSIVLPS